jgi:hypothetical protein
VGRLCGVSYRLAEDRVVRFDASPRFPDQPPAPDPTGGRPTRFQVATGEIPFVSLPRRPRAAHPTHARRLPLLVCLLAAAACAGRESANVAATADVAPLGGAQPADQAAPLELPGIEHYRRWSTRLGQGSQPGGDASFAALAQQGFRTILSVDGAMPDVDAAARHGLRYVHVPIGYDGIDPDEQ